MALPPKHIEELLLKKVVEPIIKGAAPALRGYSIFDNFRRVANDIRCDMGKGFDRLSEYWSDDDAYRFVNIALWEIIKGEELKDFQVRNLTINNGCEYEMYLAARALGNFGNYCNLLNPSSQGITIMNKTAPAIEVKTYVFGDDVSQLTEDQLIDAIGLIEAKIAGLKEIKVESLRIKAKILDLESQLAAVVEVLDSK